MKKLIFAGIMSFFFFVLLYFVFCNLDAATFGYEVTFKFDILNLKSVPIPLGFVLIISFCTGMIAIALLEALPSLYKTLEIRSKNKRIKQLEKELKLVREMQQKDFYIEEEEEEVDEEE